MTRQQLAFSDLVVQNAAVIDDRVAQELRELFQKVPRLEFVPSAFHNRAFQDVRLPIDFGRSLPRPSILARFLSLAGIRKGTKVLALGCDSGYSTALLAATGAFVFVIEPEGMLAQKTRRRLDKLNFQNVILRPGKAERGWEEHAPFDRVVSFLPLTKQEAKELTGQLSLEGGRMVVPLSAPGGEVNLALFEKEPEPDPGALRSLLLEPLEPWW